MRKAPIESFEAFDNHPFSGKTPNVTLRTCRGSSNFITSTGPLNRCREVPVYCHWGGAVNSCHCLLRDPGCLSKTNLQGRQATGRILIFDNDAGGYRHALAETLPTCRFTLEAPPEAGRKFHISPQPGPSQPCGLPPLLRLAPLPQIPSSVSAIVFADGGSEELAVQAFRLGAADDFKNSFALAGLEMSVRAILEIRKRFGRKGKSLQTGGLQRALSYFEVNFSLPVRLDDALREGGSLIGQVSTIICQTIMNIPGEVISQGPRFIKSIDFD